MTTIDLTTTATGTCCTTVETCCATTADACCAGTTAEGCCPATTAEVCCATSAEACCATTAEGCCPDTTAEVCCATTADACCATSADACCAGTSAEACCAGTSAEVCCAGSSAEACCATTADACCAPAAPASVGKRRRVTRKFVRHYLEMVASMFAGMAVLGLAVDWLVAATGADAVTRAIDGPIAMAAVMCAYMVGGMAAWMAYRRHTVRENVEMNLAMVAPMAVLVPLEIAGALTAGALMTWLHVLMLGSMWLYMLWRPMKHCH